MEDPWGSPWTADSAPPKIDLPTPPPSAHFTLENHSQSQQRQSPEKLPWEDNDPWGSWNDAGAGRASPGWRRSPALEPVASTSSSSRQVSPGPWKSTHSDTEVKSESRDERSRAEKAEEGRKGTSDSGGSLRVPLPVEEPTKPERAATPSLEPIDISRTEWEEDERKTPTQAKALSSSSEEESTSPTIAGAQLEQLPDTNTPPEIARQPSKVQELVEMYDGIAKRGASPAPSGLGTPPMVKRVEGLTDAATRELLGIEGHDSVVQDEEATQPASDALQDEEKKIETQRADHKEISGDAITEEQRETTQSPQNRPLLSIKIDLTKLDDLFPSTSLPHVEPEPVPDVIIDDTFASISERKAWYRVSRYGSMRKHNYGDEENYRGITWKTSEVRGQAIRIVRRWMEEDSIGGRVVLGRRTGPIGASMFNWDSKAPAVGIGELLAKKSKPVHSRQASLASKASTADPQSVVSSPTAAAFGWASGSFAPPPAGGDEAPSVPATTPATQKHASLPPPVVARASLDRRPDDKQDARPQPVATLPNGHGPASSLSPPVLEPHNVDDEDEDDDEDEWGEMVSSPTKDDFEERYISPEPNQKTVANDNEASFGFLDGSSKSPRMTPPKTRVAPSQLFGVGKSTSGFDVLAEASDGSEASTPTAPTMPVLAEQSPKLEKSNIDTGSPAQATPAKEPHNPEAPDNAEISNEHDDVAVAEILKNLPDLTYMLR